MVIGAIPGAIPDDIVAPMTVDPGSEIEMAVRAALPPTVAPWEVTAVLEGHTWAVMLTHEASNGLVFETGHVQADDVIGFTIDCLATNDEVQRVARAPKLEHPETVAGLRAVVQTFGWSRAEVRAVVGILEDADALGADEAEWFASSFGEDRPPPRAATIV